MRASSLFSFILVLVILYFFLRYIISYGVGQWSQAQAKTALQNAATPLGINLLGGAATGYVGTIGGDS